MIKLNSKSSYNETFKAMEEALRAKDVDSLKIILVSHDLKEARDNFNRDADKIDTMHLEEHILVSASAKGLLGLVKFIFEHQEINKSSVYKSLNYSFYTACSKGHLEVVQFLMESPSLAEHINIDYFRGIALTSSCENGHINIVRYLLDSPNLKRHADINRLYEEDNFIDLLEKVDSSRKVDGLREVIEYLIFEKNFFRDERISKFLEKPNNLVWLKMFESHELMQELSIKDDKNSNKRVKI